MLRAVLFDLGDTLFWRSAGDPKTALADGIGRAHDDLRERHHQLPPKDRYVRRVLRRMTLAHIWSRWTLREIQVVGLIQRFHRRLGISLTDAAARQYARRCHQELRRMYKPAPGAQQTLRQLADSGYRLALVSNTFMSPEVLDENLAEAGLLDFFDTRVYSCDVGLMKPHPRIFETALRRIGTPAEEALFVGDRMDADIRGAGRVGMTTVLLAPDGHVPKGRHRPDYMIRSLTEIPDLLPGRQPEAQTAH